MPRSTRSKRVLDALPDTVDFRDRMYVPTLVEVAPAIPLSRYKGEHVPILDQGTEGACTGFGLATVVNYLLRNHARRAAAATGRRPKTADEVSAWMLYVMAKRYDEWPREDYSGSSARGAMKGWHKHGVCAERLFKDAGGGDLSAEQADDALNRPLGAYYRVNHRDLVSMHSAITEVGILYATCVVHQGWADVRSGQKQIVYSPEKLGGHAFAIVAYDRDGFWIQNSWGKAWGAGGFAHLSYADWLENGTDVWVARLGAPVTLAQPAASAQMRAAAPQSYESYVYASLRPHVVTLENDGALREKGSYGLTDIGLRNILREQMPAKVSAWKTKRVLLYAHGGLVPEAAALQHAANLRASTLEAEVYPVAFIWRTDILTTIRNILEDAFQRRRDEGILDAAKNFLFDRLDDTLEPITRVLGGMALWSEMKENATLAAAPGGGGAKTAGHLLDAMAAGEIDEIHLAGHSAGAILMTALAGLLAERGAKIASLSLLAPACTIDLFEQKLRPLIEANVIKSFGLYTLDDATERDDHCGNIYHKSLLYLVAGAFEKSPRIPWINPEGTPLLGLARDVNAALPDAFWKARGREWIKAPGSPDSTARRHGDFDSDGPTLLSTLRRITSAEPSLEAAPPTRTSTISGRAALARAIRV